jgi:hypothetical protein
VVADGVEDRELHVWIIAPSTPSVRLEGRLVGVLAQRDASTIVPASAKGDDHGTQHDRPGLAGP